MDKKDTPKVFISSTLEDLEAFREKAQAAILRLNWQPINCGYWAASGNPPLVTCLEKVDDADVVLAIVAHRHGWTPPDQPNDEHKSITRLECERANLKNGIEVIPLFVDEKAPWDAKLTETHRINEAPPEKIAEIATEVGRNVASLRDFKAWLDTIGTRVLFASPEQLETEVLHALGEWAKRQGITDSGASNASVRACYLDWLRRECESVELLGLDLKESQNVRLDRVYVPAVTPPKATDEAQKRERSWEERQPDLLLDRLGEESLYVPGAPGAGKSTFCRWLALVVAGKTVPSHLVGVPEAFEEKLPEGLRDRFPVLCRLRDWAGQEQCLKGNGRWTRAQLEQSLCCWIEATQPGGLTPEVFREELAAGHCLLILDGVDEVPEVIDKHLPRRNLLTGLADALKTWLPAGNRILLTSRPYGLDDADRRRLDLAVAPLGELPEPLQTTFIRRWYAVVDPPRAQEKSAGLIAHLDGRPELTELRRNPMLLTALCVKYDEGQRLPQDVYKLYEAVTAQVLHKRYPSERQHDRPRVRLAAVALGMHRGPADRPRKTPDAEASYEEVDDILRDLTRSDRVTEGGALDHAEAREDLLSNSGLLLPRANRRAAFYHLSFQEFLAASRLKYIREDPAQVLARHASVKDWRRTLTFLFCAFADESPQAAIDAFATLETHLDPDRLKAEPLLLLCDCLEVAHARGWNLKERYFEKLRYACEHALAHLSPPERAHLWRTLGQLDWDDRSGVGLKDGLPDIAWTEEILPELSFLYGDAREPMRLDHPFRIAIYPITNAQYQCFSDDKGYELDEWWQGLADRPDPARPRWDYPNHPRETVSWYEATAFCRWLTERLREKGRLKEGWMARLPTEQEWERAARGADGREFPWGKEFQSGYANIDETWGEEGPYHVGQTTAAGIYPQGASPTDALDMAGNVWEWCFNPYDPEDTSADGPRVLRGGSWDGYRDLARCAFRYWGNPGYRGGLIGFRVCCAPPIP
jgi:formylglycine-generating enzyme required for sulfatase activity